MTDMQRLSTDDQAQLAERMRVANTQRILVLLENLTPYIDGSIGPVSPNHANSYLKAVRELGLLWHAYDKVPAPVEDVKGADEEQMVLEARQAAVLAEFKKLREVGAVRRPRS